jgi:signal transduction histidine kinase
MLLGGAIFALDLSLPLGVAAGTPYVAVVLTGWWAGDRRQIYLLAMICSALMVAGFYFSPPGGIVWVVLANRGLALFSIWITAVLLAQVQRYDAALRVANIRLEQKVEERTAALRAAQGALVRKERLATLGQLTGTVAHELRNPLGVIANSLHTIRHKCADANLGLDEALDRAGRNIERCNGIITELLDFARAKGIQRQRTMLDTWLSNVLRSHRIADGITLQCRLQAGSAAIEFDPEQLRRAVINVVENACQAMANGTGGGVTATAELTVATRVTGERVEIDVSDTGPGIPEDALPQVREPLFSTKAFGTGLGLPTVQNIMEAHDGGLEIISRVGRGTRVTLWLPHGEAGGPETKG